MRSKLTIGPLIGISLLLALLLSAMRAVRSPAGPHAAPRAHATPTPEGRRFRLTRPVRRPPAEAVVEELPPADQRPPTPRRPRRRPPDACGRVIINTNMNVNGGPGTNYNIIGAASAGERYVVTGRNDASSWWQIDFQGQNGWVFNDLVTAQNTGAVAVAVNIRPRRRLRLRRGAAAAPTTAAGAAAPRGTGSAATGEPSYNKAILQRCDPNQGVTYAQGTTYRNGQPTTACPVDLQRYAVDEAVVATVPKSGPHQGYEGWNTGFYSHIIQHDGPREGDWFFWIVDGNGQRISAAAHVHTDGFRRRRQGQQAVIDFDSRAAPNRVQPCPAP